MLFSWKREAISTDNDLEEELQSRLFYLRCRILDFIELPFCLAGKAFNFIRRNIWTS
jgi:hypothetical protein